MLRRSIIALLAGSALVPFAAHAQELPTGGSVAAGQASIGGPAGGALTITQGSDRAIINWQSFSVGAGNRVDIVQPGADAALLNRVTGDTSSTIAGQINANGRVFLVNPNGILITPTGTVNAAGFVASSLDIADKDFLAGDIVVIGRGGSVANQGTISIVRGGYAALIGGKVDNAGLIVAPLGKVGLGAGTRATLDLSGDGFLQVALPAGDGGVAMSGRIVADGGAVVLSAAQARAAARGTVNLSGTIQATGLGSAGGHVTLTGDDITLAGATIDTSGASGGGTIRIGGGRQGGGALAHADTVSVDAATVLNADATVAGNGGDIVLWSDGRTDYAGAISAKGTGGGNGGEAEVSGKYLGYAGTADLTGARFGTLLLDPYNVTISTGASSGNSVTPVIVAGVLVRYNDDATANDSVINVNTLQSLLATANVQVTTGTGGGQDGNITVAAPITWNSNAQLTLTAARNIAVNAPINVAGGGAIALNYSTTDPITGGLSFARTGSISFADGPPSQALVLNGSSFTLIRTVAQLDAIDTTGLGGRYALARDLDAAGLATSVPVIGAGDGSTVFAGVLEGLGHTIANLSMSAQSVTYIGLIGSLTGTVRDLGLINADIRVSTSGSNYGGVIAGLNNGRITNVFATGTIAAHDAGGLVGSNAGGVVTNSFANVNVLGSDIGFEGGIAGRNNGTISNVYSTGPVNGGIDGGLVGLNDDLGTISNSYATGYVKFRLGLNGGGLVGSAQGTFRDTSYWDVQTTGRNSVDGTTLSYPGAIGLSTAQLQSQAAVDGLGAAFGGGDGVYPYLKSFYPSGVQAISGVAYTDAGATPLMSPTFYQAKFISLSINGADQPQVATGANGYYYFAVPQGTLATAGTRLFVKSEAGATVATATGSVALPIYGGQFAYVPTATTYSVAEPARTAAIAALSSAQRDSVAGLMPSYIATGTSGFTLDQPLTVAASTSFTTTAGPLTVAAPITVSGSSALTLTAATALAVNANIGVPGGGTVNLGWNGGVLNVSGADLSFGNGASLSFADGQTGQALTINGAAYTLLRTAAQVDAIDTLGLSGRYAMAHDIDAGGTTYTAALFGTGLGRLAFAGTLMGLNHAVANLTINAPTAAFTGLIGHLTGTVRDLRVGGSVRGSNNVGGLVGYNDGGIVRNVSTIGSVVGTGDFTGGLIGYNESGTIANAFARGNVSGGNYVGGLIGSNEGGSVGDVNASGLVTGSGQNVGGVAGLNNGTLTNASYTGTRVSGVALVGGLVGLNDADGAITSGTSAGQVSATGQTAGGLVGYNSGSVTTSVTTASVSGAGIVGGFVGTNAGTISTVRAEGAVTSSDAYTGGFVGYNAARIQDADALGAVTGTIIVGGFAGLSSGTLSNVRHLTGAVSGTTTVGGLVGYNMGGIYTSTAAVPVSGTGQVGGLVGANIGGVVNGSSASGAVTGSADSSYVGGVVGFNTGEVSADTATGQVSGGNFVGGVAGANQGSVSGGRYAPTGAGVSGVFAVGGFVGLNDTAGRVTGGNASGTVAATGTAAGGAVGYNLGVVFTGTSAANVTGRGMVGGFVGVNAAGASISRTVARGTVTSTAAYAGGLVGFNQGSVALSTSASPTTGTDFVGGLLGWSNGSVDQSYATGMVRASGSYAGGLLGLNAGAVTDVYATGAVAGNMIVGGLVGINFTGGAITNAYATGAVSQTFTGSNLAGGVAGFDMGTLTNIYWDVATTGRTVGVAVEQGTATNVTAIGGTTGRSPTSAATYVGFDFTNRWRIAADSRPTLINARTP